MYVCVAENAELLVLSFFKIRLWHARPLPPFMANGILNFHFLNTSLCVAFCGDNNNLSARNCSNDDRIVNGLGSSRASQTLKKMSQKAVVLGFRCPDLGKASKNVVKLRKISQFIHPPLPRHILESKCHKNNGRQYFT